MAWSYNVVTLDDNESPSQRTQATTLDGSIVILDKTYFTSGGGRSLTELGRDIKIPYQLEFDVDGIKAFVTKDVFDIYGIITKDILKILVVHGIIKQVQANEISIVGSSAHTAEDVLNLKGISSKIIEGVINLKGIKSKDVEGYDLVKGIKSYKTEEFEKLVGQVSSEIELFEKTEGVKLFVGNVNLDLAGTKKMLTEYESKLKGEKDIRKIIIALLNLD